MGSFNLSECKLDCKLKFPDFICVLAQCNLVFTLKIMG